VLRRRLGLTSAGWTLAGGSAGLAAAGRLFGIVELFMAGAGGLALAIGAVLSVRLTTLRLDVSRVLHPPRVHAGTPSRVELRVRNRGLRRTPVLALRDPVGRGRSARVLLAPLGQDQLARAAYRLPTERRGVLSVGPLAVEISDPFGLASQATVAAPVTELTVWPALEDVQPLPHTQGDDPHGGADHPNTLSAGGEDFYALRSYAVGDDLRRVHWRTTARLDELMVRQDERPWQGRATVLLDTRRASHTPVGFERAVSAATSVIVACWRHRFLVRLVDTAGVDSGFGAGTAHVEAILERLALARLVEAGRLPTILAALRRPGNGGSLAALLGGWRVADADAVARLRPTFGSITTVVFTAGRTDPPADAARARTLLIDDTTAFAPAWDAALRHRRAPRLTPAAAAARGSEVR
jgi:uncharacterized protein (DUF58 family)